MSKPVIRTFAFIRDSHNRVLAWDGAEHLATQAENLHVGDTIDRHEQMIMHMIPAGTVTHITSKRTSKARQDLGDVPYYLHVTNDLNTTFVVSPERDVVLAKTSETDAYVIEGFHASGVAILAMPDHIDGDGAFDNEGYPQALFDEELLRELAKTGYVLEDPDEAQERMIVDCIEEDGAYVPMDRSTLTKRRYELEMGNASTLSLA